MGDSAGEVINQQTCIHPEHFNNDFMGSWDTSKQNSVIYHIMVFLKNMFLKRKHAVSFVLNNDKLD